MLAFDFDIPASARTLDEVRDPLGKVGIHIISDLHYRSLSPANSTLYIPEGADADEPVFSGSPCEAAIKKRLIEGRRRLKILDQMRIYDGQAKPRVWPGRRHYGMGRTGVQIFLRIANDYVLFAPLLGEDGEGDCDAAKLSDMVAIDTITYRTIYGGESVGCVKHGQEPDFYQDLAGRVPFEEAMEVIRGRVTVPEQEARVLESVRRGWEDWANSGGPENHVDTQIVVDFFRDTIIDATKDVEALEIWKQATGSYPQY